MSVELKEKAVALLPSTTTQDYTILSLQATGATTLYTVPTGKVCVLSHLNLVSGSTADVANTAKFTAGQVSALTDFLAEQTLTNVVSGKMAICRPVPSVTPLAGVAYPAGTIIQVNVTTLDANGGTDWKVFLFGFLYSA
jgi:hypothetical protein